MPRRPSALAGGATRLEHEHSATRCPHEQRQMASVLWWSTTPVSPANRCCNLPRPQRARRACVYLFFSGIISATVHHSVSHAVGVVLFRSSACCRFHTVACQCLPGKARLSGGCRQPVAREYYFFQTHFREETVSASWALLAWPCAKSVVLKLFCVVYYSTRSEAGEMHRRRPSSVTRMTRFRNMSIVVALVGMLSTCPAHAGKPGRMQPLRLRGGATPLHQV